MDFIELHGGVITSSSTYSARSAQAHPDEIGQFRFFVSYIEPESDWCIWSGPSYEQAIVIAERARKSFGITEPVRDLVITGGSE